MIEIRDINEILEKECQLKKQTNQCSKILIDDIFYNYFLTNYKGIEITPDINIFEYEHALEQNRYLKKEYSDISEKMWIFGNTGQGDSWLLDKKTYNVLFYDHDQGEMSLDSEFINLNIDFKKFIQMGFLLKDGCKLLENNIESSLIETVINKELSKLNEDLPITYPFYYLE